MNNKILVTIVLPTMETEYDIYIPINKKIGTIKKNVLLAIKDLSDNSFDLQFDNAKFIERESGREYLNDTMVKDLGIKNGAKIILI